MSGVLELYASYALVLTFSTALMILVFTESGLRLTGLRPRDLLHLAKVGWFVSLLAPLFVKCWPRSSFLISSGRLFSTNVQTPDSRILSSLHSAFSSQTLEANWKFFIVCFLALGFIFKLISYSKDWKHIEHEVKAAVSLRHIGRLEILSSESLCIPFAFHNFAKAYVVIPHDFLLNSELFALSLRHEIQHHRQRDTLWIHLWKFLELLFFWNPLLKIFLNRLSEIQELACDEVLLGRAVCVHAYSRCLLKGAQYGIGSSPKLIGTMSMTETASIEPLLPSVVTKVTLSGRRFLSLNLHPFLQRSSWMKSTLF